MMMQNLAPQPATKANQSSPLPRRPTRQPQDTAEGCLIRAAADRDIALTKLNANARLRYEHSANTWSDRGKMIARLDASFEKRMKAKR